MIGIVWCCKNVNTKIFFSEETLFLLQICQRNAKIWRRKFNTIRCWWWCTRVRRKLHKGDESNEMGETVWSLCANVHVCLSCMRIFVGTVNRIGGEKGGSNWQITLFIQWCISDKTMLLPRPTAALWITNFNLFLWNGLFRNLRQISLVI